jgi:hypothetical protein
MTPTTLVCGPPGAGKSTYVAKHKGPCDLVLDVDSLFTALSGLTNRQKPPCLLEFVLAARKGIIDLLAAGYLGPPHAWIIMCGENNDVRAALAQRLGADVVVLPVSVGTCVKRMQQQGRSLAHITEMVGVGVRWQRRFKAMPNENVTFASSIDVDADGWPIDEK